MSLEAVGFLDAKTFPGIGSYFKTVGRVYLAPGSPDLIVPNRVNFEASWKLTLLSLATEINASVPDGGGSSVVVYCHGTANELFIPIVASAPKNRLDMEEAVRLRQHLDQIEKGTNQSYVPTFLKLPKKKDAEELVDYLLLAREKKIKTLMFIACNMGQNAILLHSLGRIFGAENAIAPRRRTGFIQTDNYVFRKKPGELEQFNAAFDKLVHGVSGCHKYTLPSGRVTFTVQDTGHAKFKMKLFYASNEKALDEFLRDYAGYPPGFTMGFTEAEAADTAQLSRQHKTIALHGLWDGTKFIWPKEKEYANHMLNVPCKPAAPQAAVAPAATLAEIHQRQPEAKKKKGFIRGLLRRRDTH